jgi:hypothetical protein
MQRECWSKLVWLRCKRYKLWRLNLLKNLGGRIGVAYCLSGLDSMSLKSACGNKILGLNNENKGLWEKKQGFEKY